MPRLASIIKRERPDIIHAQTRVTQLAASILSRRFNIRYVSTCHGFFKPRLSRKVFGLWGDRVIAISEAVRDHLINDFNVEKDRIELIHNGVDISRFEREFSNNDLLETRHRFNLGDGPVIGAIGRLSPVKGLDELVRASSRIKDVRLLIVGDGPEKEKLTELTGELGIKERVRFMKSDPDTPRLLSIMDVFVFPSVQEGLGLSLIEALASGKAVVATDVGGIGSLVKHDETGLLVKRGDSTQLADTIKRLLNDKNLRERLGSNGRALAKTEYSLDKMADKTEKLYKALL